MDYAMNVIQCASSVELKQNLDELSATSKIPQNRSARTAK